MLTVIYAVSIAIIVICGWGIITPILADTENSMFTVAGAIVALSVPLFVFIAIMLWLQTVEGRIIATQMLDRF